MALSIVGNCLRPAEDDRNPTVQLQQCLATGCDGIDTMSIMPRAPNVIMVKLQWAVVSELERIRGHPTV